MVHRGTGDGAQVKATPRGCLGGPAPGGAPPCHPIPRGQERPESGAGPSGNKRAMGGYKAGPPGVPAESPPTLTALCLLCCLLLPFLLPFASLFLCLCNFSCDFFHIHFYFQTAQLVVRRKTKQNSLSSGLFLQSVKQQNYFKNGFSWLWTTCVWEEKHMVLGLL